MSLKPAYFAKEAAVNTRRNLLMAFAAVLTVAFAMLFVGSTMMIWRVFENVTARWKNDVQINAFLVDDATQSQISAAEVEIREWNEVKSVTFVSKEEALEEFREMFADQEQLVDSVTADTLPASFRIALHDPNTLSQVQNRLEKVVGVEDVVSAQEEVKRVQRIVTIVNIVLGIVGVILLIAAVVLVSNTIRLAIYARRREIEIMKLVGATNWFIRWPFILEGLFQGIVGAAVAISVLLIAKAFLVEWLARTAPFVPWGIPTAFAVFTSGIILVFSIAIAAGGSALSLRRYLDV
ncbi:MAG: ABC transporter permease [Acidimicrobiia bacterium]|nr:ABC transporter permease [Acidimicrobiia bacterium]